MCNQAVSLVAAECERQGISSSAIVLLREIAERVRPPRALWVPFPHGYPLGRPGEPDLQKEIMRAALGLLELSDAAPPLLRAFRPEKAG